MWVLFVLLSSYAMSVHYVGLHAGVIYLHIKDRISMTRHLIHLILGVPEVPFKKAWLDAHSHVSSICKHLGQFVAVLNGQNKSDDSYYVCVC